MNEETQYFGRNQLYSSKKKEELNKDTIKEILEEVYPYQQKNAKEIDNLIDFTNGNQPILRKVKEVRPSINNKIVVNLARFGVDFKKGFIYGKPIQYVQRTDSYPEEISKLNSYMVLENKQLIDQQLAEYRYICGTSFRFVDVNKNFSKASEDDEESPFFVRALDPRRTYVVYSTDVKGEQLFGAYYSYFSEQLMTSDGEPYMSDYTIHSVYTDDRYYEYKCVGGRFEFIKEEPLVIKGKRIIEYPFNMARTGLVELTTGLFNALNRVTSGDIDDLDQFIQSLLVFINQDVDEEELQKMLKIGAIKIVSKQNLPADVKQLVSNLSHADTKVLKDDLMNYLFLIWGIPKQSDSASYGDTGTAQYIGSGWTMAEQMALQDELSFKAPEREFLKFVIKVCKTKAKSGITSLKSSELESRFTRNKSDNIQSKAQALSTLMSCQVAPEVAFSVSELFSDPADVVEQSKEFYGDKFWDGKDSQGDTPPQLQPFTGEGTNVENELPTNQNGEEITQQETQEETQTKE